MGIEGDVVSCLYEIVKVKEIVKENVGVSQKQEFSGGYPAEKRFYFLL